jgi:hypothetical protein
MDYVYFIASIRRDESSGQMTHDVFRHERSTAERLRQMHEDIRKAQLEFGRIPVEDMMSNGPIYRRYGVTVAPMIMDYFLLLRSSDKHPFGFFTSKDGKYRAGTILEEGQERIRQYADGQLRKRWLA